MTDRARELVKLPSKALFCHGTIPEPLSAECRQWLVDQLHSYPKRVNEDRTCAIGALTEMATTEFCRLMAEQSLTPPEGDTLSGEVVERVARAMQKTRDEIGATEQQRIAFAYAEAAMRSAIAALQSRVSPLHARAEGEK